jgi:methyl-accepting chemotaxis protein
VKSIKVKLIAAIMALVIIPVLFIFLVTGVNIRDLSHEGFRQSATGQLKLLDNTITVFLDETKMNAEMLAKSPTIQRADDVLTSFVDTTQEKATTPWPEDSAGMLAVDMLKLIQDTHPNYVEVFLGNEFGAFVTSNDGTMPPGYDPRKRPWYLESLASRSTASLSKAYMSTTGEAVASIMHPIVSGSNLIGVVGIDISLARLTDMVKSIRLGETGYIVLVQDDGVVLADPRNEENNFKNIKELGSGYLSELAALSRGTRQVRIDETPYVGLTYTSPNLGWHLIGLITQDEIQGPAKATLKNIGLISLASLLLVAGAVWLLSQRLVVSPVARVVAYLEGIARGDYESRITEKRSDEMGTIFSALNTTSQALSELVGSCTLAKDEAQDKARQAEVALEEAEASRRMAEKARQAGMLEAAGSLAEIVDRLASATDELAAQVAEASRGTQRQRERITENATAIEEMNASVGEVARSAEQSASHADQVRSLSDDGGRTVEKTIEAIAQVNTQSEEMKRSLKVLGQQAQSISAIITVINDIADQTNLLALNAAIEAARAGDAGRGFAVVADEVRKLAEKTMSATKEVESAVHNIQQGAELNISLMEQASGVVAKSTQLAGEAGKALTTIRGSVEESADQVRSIATASEEQSTVSEMITRSISEINAIADETADSMQHAAQAVTELAAMADDLRGVIQRMQSA